MAHNPLPYSEEANTNRALSTYAASKKAAEAMCYRTPGRVRLEEGVARLAAW